MIEKLGVTNPIALERESEEIYFGKVLDRELSKIPPEYIPEEERQVFEKNTYDLKKKAIDSIKSTEENIRKVVDAWEKLAVELEESFDWDTACKKLARLNSTASPSSDGAMSSYGVFSVKITYAKDIKYNYQAKWTKERSSFLGRDVHGPFDRLVSDAIDSFNESDEYKSHKKMMIELHEKIVVARKRILSIFKSHERQWNFGGNAGAKKQID